MKRSGLLLAASIATLVLFSLRQDIGAATSNSTETYKQLNLFGEVFERVRAEYVDDVSDDSLVESAINGMLTSLDPHSNYLNTKNFNDMKVQTRGEFGGLGIEVSMENGLVKVVSPIDDTPAAHAGLKPGDLITHLDGDPVQGMTLPEAVEKMRGPVSSEIKLTIRREGKEPFDVKLTRATIKIQSVRSHLEGDNIAYIRITTFNEQTDVGLNNAMKNLKQQAGGKLLGVVLDLRNDPGGLLDQAVAVSDAFLEKGEIVSTRGRRSEDAQRYNARPGDIAAGLPVAVLINGGSASASEIVAGALQDHHRAILLGTRSFGKGSVQTIIPLPGHGAMRLTTARYYTPSGRSIQAKGIDPDIVVEAAKIEKTPEKGEAKVATASDLKRDDSGDGGVEQGSVDPSIMGTPADYQLTRAVDMLRGIALFNGRVVN
jgi:carboxyl-terminal processing protease